MSEENISGIYNYCDRWCERCSFTSRCLNFEKIPSLEEQKEMDGKQVMEVVARNFAETLGILQKLVEEQGLDWETIQREAKENPYQEPEFTPSEKELEQHAKDYYTLVINWNDSNETLLKEKDTAMNQALQLGIEGTLKTANTLRDALEVSRFYTFFISAKVGRALASLEKDGLEIEKNLIQNDENGSAKVAYMAVERSLEAWKIILANFPSQVDASINILATLQKIKRGITAHFPYHQQFIRPGFDTV